MLCADGDETRHFCNKCNKPFKYLWTLKRHLRYECEKQEQQFVCAAPDCSYRDRRKGNLIQHIVSAHPEMAKTLLGIKH